jgi:hypothetical protein
VHVSLLTANPYSMKENGKSAFFKNMHNYPKADAAPTPKQDRSRPPKART